MKYQILTFYLYMPFYLDFMSCICHLRILGTTNVCALRFSRFISVYNYPIVIRYKYALSGFKRMVKCRTRITLNLFAKSEFKARTFL